jgi:hypothetical protein
VGAQQNNGGGSSPVSITVTSVPTGLTVAVNGSSCTTPCVPVQWTPGSSQTIAVTAPTQAGATGTQYIFSSWSDGGAISHTVTAPTVTTTYTASFTTQYLLTTAASPSSEGSIGPGSGWYNAGTAVSVSATATLGNQFTGFAGALTGATTPQSVTMNAPATVTADFSAVGSGPSWYSTSWNYRKPITISHAKVSGSSNLTNFPVLISLPTDANLEAQAQANGNDILFTASDGVTKLNHEIEVYASSTGQLVAWVQVPVVSPTADTVVYLYYGNGTATNQQNATAVWDSSYKVVNHFEQTSGTLKDSSGNNNVGIVSGGAASTPAGLAGNGYSLDGSSGLITIDNNASWATTTTAATLEFWFKPSSAAGTYHTLMSIGNWGATNDLYELANGNIAVNMDQVANPWGSVGCVTGALGFLTTPDGNYHHFAVGYTGIYTSNGFFGLYVDGVLACSDPYTTGGAILNQNSSNLCLGGACNGLNTGGSIDEFRLSVGTMRSAAWIATEFNNESSPSTFFSVGAQQ